MENNNHIHGNIIGFMFEHKIADDKILYQVEAIHHGSDEKVKTMKHKHFNVKYPIVTILLDEIKLSLL